MVMVGLATGCSDGSGPRLFNPIDVTFLELLPL